MGTTSSVPPASTGKIPQEKIAQRAYEKWVQRGRPHGDGVQDWLDAEMELKSEATKGTSTATSQQRR
jgi:hypothetical protein